MSRKNAIIERISRMNPAEASEYKPTSRPGQSYVDVTFQNGQTARLDMSNRFASAWSNILQSLQKSGLPAYAEIDPDTREITQLMSPVVVRVEKLTQLASGDVEVELFISQARHVLKRSNPDFQELYDLLQAAWQKDATIAVTETLDAHEIIDVTELPNPMQPAVASAEPPPDTRSYAAISLERAQELYDLVNARCCDPVTAPAPYIPFWYPDDGCWGRAHEMRRLMIDDGTTPEKVWIYGSLHVHTHNNPTCAVHWNWHVAPIVQVQTDSGSETYVIDPSMFDEPVPQSVWVYAQGDPSADVVHTDSSVFYRSSSGAVYYDDDYSQTESVLAQYRNQLILRSASSSGPPPYTACYRSDIFIRDNLQDEGLEPLVGGGISRSPDVNHYRQELLNPTATLGSASAKDRDDLFEDIEYGQPNYLYVRLQNRGKAASGCEVDLYWMPPSTLPTPTSWNPIGSLSIGSISPGEFKILGPLVWTDIPAVGHYCFVAVLGNSQDPKPDLNQVNDINEFYDLIRNSNNVTWKNFDVEDVFVDSYLRYEFQIQGWPKIAYQSDLELDTAALPSQTSVELRILKRLIEGVRLEYFSQQKETEHHRYLLSTSGTQSAIRGMPLKASDCSEATVYITMPKSAPGGRYEFAVRQLVEGKEVGRITKRFIIGDHPYVANRRSREVHVANCEWVTKMSGRNKIAYQDLKLALQHGHNGCRYCLPEHDTD